MIQKEIEELYLQAKEAYYAGEPIMSDDEFDRLEQSLRDEGSEVIEVVGATDRNLKFQHLSPMVSLAKAQADLDGTPPVAQLKKWFEDFPDDEIFEGTPKYDGNAVNLIYVRDGNGKAKLSIAVTRGDKLKGRDVTKKLLKSVPHSLDIDKDVEVRGEVVIPMPIFNAKYSTFKNARNFIAGVLGRDASDETLFEEIEFMGVEVRIHDGDYEYPKDTQKFFKDHGFNHPHGFHVLFTKNEFEATYYKMKDHREKDSPFQLDGFVIKASEGTRKKMGETGHHPNWAIAVKFPPKEGVTHVIGYKWNIGTTGEITPIVRLEGVDLDGTTIKNVAGFNLGHLIRNKIYPGAKVAIAKAGDIIPQIMKVLEPGNEAEFSYPHECPSCGQPAQIDSIHLYCPNEDCEGKLFKKFLTAMRVLQMKKFGTVTVKTLYDCGFKSVIDIFDTSKFNKDSLVATGKFKPGRTLDMLFEEMGIRY
jgi:DNA ligase (NAD+)